MTRPSQHLAWKGRRKHAVNRRPPRPRHKEGKEVTARKWFGGTSILIAVLDRGDRRRRKRIRRQEGGQPVRLNEVGHA